MLTGFNTEIESDGVVYHIQTEDRGQGNPLIESLIYVRGEILATRRTEYRNLLEAGADMNAIQTLMERQHKTIVEAIRSGRIELLTEPPVGAEGDTTVSRRSAAAQVRAVEPLDVAKRPKRSLDEVISDWLVEQQREERVRVRVGGGEDLRFGAPFELTIAVRSTPNDQPVAGAHALVRFLSTAMKPLRLAEGDSDDAGELLLQGEVPVLERGQGLLVVSVQHSRGNDEVKFLINR